MKLDRIEVRIVDSYLAADKLSLAGGVSDPNQTASYGLVWQPKPLHVLIVEGGLLVAHVGLVQCTVRVGGQPVSVAGFGGVLTRPDCRGKGFGQMAMQKAEEHILQQGDAKFGLLFCRDAVRSWYERMGWTSIEGPVWIDQPEGSIQSPLVVMVKYFGQEEWPDGVVELRCLPW